MQTKRKKNKKAMGCVNVDFISVSNFWLWKPMRAPAIWTRSKQRPSDKFLAQRTVKLAHQRAELILS